VVSHIYDETALEETEKRFQPALATDTTGSLEQLGQALRGQSGIDEERLRIAADSANGTMYEWDLRTGDMQIFGLVQDRMGDRPMPQDYATWKSLVHPDDREQTISGVRRHIETGERYDGEFRVTGRDNRIYHYSNRGQALRTTTGEPYKWIGLITDITDRREADEAAWQLTAIVDACEDGIIGTNLSGAITNWNAGAEKLLGYSATEVLGRPFSLLLVTSRDEIEPSYRHLIRIDETVLVRKDGSHAHVSLILAPVRKTSGETTGCTAIARDISTRKISEQVFVHQAQHDHLTGLPNRLLLVERLEDAIGRSRQRGLMAGLIYVDLDGFKFVNETLGHEAGDVLLQQVATRLTTCVRQGDTLARVGGDEFMLVVTEIRDAETALAVGERLRVALRKPFIAADRELHITASIGISMYPDDGVDVSTLRRNADAAMYEAKHCKDRIQFYLPTMRVAFIERLELETDLHHALERNELTLHYQPLFTVSGERQTAFEALARWRHPVRGLIAPMRFIPLAEETGLIGRLGNWVLKEACQQCRIWQDRLPGVRVAVNVSALQFARHDFIDSVLTVLAETGLSGGLLELELTETMLMREMEDSILKMSILRDQGVRMSIDDFGTGYSSLGYLQKLPIDTLKIDRCFVADLGINSTALPLITGMISLAHSIGKRVVVEGVETQQQLNLLRKMNCDEVQGYFLGRPAPLPELCALSVT
jgi:diguanylate cyclase (GGDEF)-like protein/PAS domain S-box-containing protein